MATPTLRTSTEENYSYLNQSYNDLIRINTSTRHTFLVIYVVITTLSVIGNVAAIYSISKRNYRRFQKTCIISLAFSDILGTVAIATTNITHFVNQAMIWPLGSFLCYFLPLCQTAGILASSIALMVIAMDRYRNVIYALSKRWNPRLIYCLLTTALLWVVCFAVAYPVSTYYKSVYYPTGDNDYECCIMPENKVESYKNYTIVIVVVVFLPLLVVFIWFYHKIAILVWKHRKPFSTIFKKKENSSTSTSTRTVPKNLNKLKTQDDIRVERKIRTFKIIVTLMVVFIYCRLPYYTIQIMKIVNQKSINDSQVFWDLNYGFLALQIVNCVLNPLLYTFLNLTLQVWTKAVDFVWEICCFCCSRAEFESFEKENPFDVENFENKRNSKVRFQEEGKY